MAKAHDAGNGDTAFRCPGCGLIHVLDGRWTFNGSYELPTFGPAFDEKGKPSPYSLLVHHGPGGKEVCHSYIENGRIQFLGDCTHAMKGQAVDLPEWNGW